MKSSENFSIVFLAWDTSTGGGYKNKSLGYYLEGRKTHVYTFSRNQNFAGIIFAIELFIYFAVTNFQKFRDTIISEYNLF